MMKKALTFVAAQLLALGTFSALAVLIISALSMYGFRDYIGSRAHSATVVYSEIPIAFLCACFAQLVYRVSPMFMATVFVLLKTCVRIACIPYVATNLHFWAETVLSYGAALAGAVAVAGVLSGKERREPMHPAPAYLIAVAASVAAWGITWTVALMR